MWPGKCSVWADGRKLGRLARQGEPARGERWRVIALEQVEPHARVVWLLGQYLLQHCGSFEPVGAGRVSGHSAHEQRQRIEDRCLPILRMVVG
jgi:hypothetical protein